MKMNKWVSILAFMALVLTVIASVSLFFLPIYAGTSVSSSNPEPVGTSATLIQVSGYRVLFILGIPPVLAWLGFVAVRMIARDQGGGRMMLWVSAALLAVFSLLTGFSVGEFYAPSALAMLVSASLARRISLTQEA